MNLKQGNKLWISFKPSSTEDYHMECQRNGWSQEEYPSIKDIFRRNGPDIVLTQETKKEKIDKKCFHRFGEVMPFLHKEQRVDCL